MLCLSVREVTTRPLGRIAKAPLPLTMPIRMGPNTSTVGKMVFGAGGLFLEKINQDMNKSNDTFRHVVMTVMTVCLVTVCALSTPE